MNQSANTLAELPLGQLKSLVRRLGCKSAAAAPPRIKRRDFKSHSSPLSYAQERLWVINQIETDSGAYNIAFCIRYAGNVNPPAIRAGINEIIRRHEVLNSTFRLQDGIPVQRISDQPCFSLAIVDLSGTAELLREEEAVRLAREQACRSLDLAHGPLILATLLRLNRDLHILVVCVHHTVFDGWSSHIFSREFESIHNRFAAGVQSTVADLPLQYADFAVWQRKWLQGDRLQSLVSYWKEQLAGPTVLELPTDFPRPPVYTHRGSRESLELAPALSKGIDELSQRLGVTQFMVMLAAFNILLYRNSGQTDILIGAPIANRTTVEVEDLIGCFVNTLVFRTDLSGDPTFEALCARVSETCRQAYAHQDLPFEKLVDEINPAREMSRNPLFQAAFNYNNTPMRFNMNDDYSGKIADGMLNGGTAVFELTLNVDPVNRDTSGTGVNCTLEYNSDLFEPVTIRRMLDQLAALIEAAVANSSMRLSDMPVLSRQAHHQLVCEWNDTAAEVTASVQVHLQFEERARERPDAIALQYENSQVTYRRLNRSANRLANYLRSRGIGEEHLVAICLHRSIEWVVAVLAAVKAGAAYIPLDPDSPPERLQPMLESAHIVITSGLAAKAITSSSVEIVNVDRDRDAIRKQNANNPGTIVQDSSLVYAIYTSGSTGRPKAVGIEHRSLTNLVEWHRREYSIGNRDRATQVAQASFDASVWELWPYLASGARIEIANQETRLDPRNFIQWTERREITISFLPTPLAEAALAQKWPASSQLKRLLTGGDRLRQGGRPGQAFSLINHYGPTENTVVATCGVVDETGLGSPSIGRPIMNTRVYVLDTDRQPAAIGVTGELAIAGRGLARGYLGCPDLTAEKFVPHPYGVTGERLYLTGDLVKCKNDGRIDFINRKDTQVKIRGYRLELGEIEAVLNGHPGVKQSLVVALDGTAGDKRLIAYFIPEEKSLRTSQELKQFSKEKLPEYMIPSAFVKLDRFPLTRHGKVDVKALPVPEAGLVSTGQDYTPPRTELERAIAAIWQDVLGVTDIGVRENFFDRGGNSLLIVRMAGALRDNLGMELSVVDVFNHPTISSLASLAAPVQDDHTFVGSILERAKMRQQAMDR